MATTRIMPLHTGKGRSVGNAIRDILDYVENPDKTDRGRLITAHGCNGPIADAEFLFSKQQYLARTGRRRGADDVIAYHVRQAFVPGEVTPEEANRIGVEFARRFTKDDHAFIVCTHIDRAHVHNHIIWNSTSLDCTRKFRNFWGSTRAVRRLSDTLCIENGLSIVEDPKPKGQTYDKWLGTQAKPSHRELLRQAIAQRRLDVPITGRARVREFGATLKAMDDLRQNLAESLESQWGMEQQRRLELAALTHDLKTPLSVISGNAELLGEDALTESQRESVDAIFRSALRLQDYVAQLRTMTGSEAALSREKETVSLPALAEGWREVGQSLCGAKPAAFRCPEVPRLELAVYRGDLDRAVSNLLDNAARYTPAGGTVTLSVTADGETLTIAVEDTGPGFSAEGLARGEQAFYTSDASRPQEGHMGMGLYFAAQTAKRHGGALRLANTGLGARAELVLPIN